MKKVFFIITMLSFLFTNAYSAQQGTVSTIKQYQTGQTTVKFDVGGSLTSEVPLADADPEVKKSLLAILLTAKSSGATVQFRACNAEAGVWKWCDITILP